MDVAITDKKTQSLETYCSKLLHKNNQTIS